MNSASQTTPWQVKLGEMLNSGLTQGVVIRVIIIMIEHQDCLLIASSTLMPGFQQSLEQTVA